MVQVPRAFSLGGGRRRAASLLASLALSGLQALAPHGASPALVAAPVAAAALSVSRAARAEQEASVTSRRIKLAQVWADCPAALCNTDLGAAPPPGGSVLIVKDAIVRSLARLHDNPRSLALPEAVRVKSLARVISQSELGEQLPSLLAPALPPGVTLERAECKMSITVPLTATFGAVELGKLPKRPGKATTSAMLEVMHEGQRVTRLPLVLEVVIDAEAGRPDVSRGQELKLVIKRNAATISAVGVAMRDAEIGQVITFKVAPTGRVVRARVQSSELALVTEGR